MTILPKKITYDLGRDNYGRKIEAVIESGLITLHQHAASQRDESQFVVLSMEQARALGEIAKP